MLYPGLVRANAKKIPPEWECNSVYVLGVSIEYSVLISVSGIDDAVNNCHIQYKM